MVCQIKPETGDKNQYMYATMVRIIDTKNSRLLSLQTAKMHEQGEQ